jgi:hypothetical protein
MSKTPLEVNQSSVYRTPRWVKWFGIVTLIAIVLLAVIILTGDHGPGRHMPSAGQNGTSVETTHPGHGSPVEHGTTQP